MVFTTPIIIIIAVLSFINLVIIACGFLWYKAKQKEKLNLTDNKNILLTKDPIILTKTSSLLPLEIPFAIPSSCRAVTRDDFTRSNSVDIKNYEEDSKHKTRSKTPILNFEIFYDFRKNQVKITLLSGQNLSRTDRKRVLISVFMSHCNIIYRTLEMHGPNPCYNEEFCFPLESIRLSEEPAVTLKFNVRHINEFGETKPFGSLDVNVEEVFTARGKGVNPKQGEGIISMSVNRTSILTGENVTPSVLVSLAYRPQSGIINVLVVEAKDLYFTSHDKNVYTKVTLLNRDRVQKEMTSSPIPMSVNPEFKQDFMFSSYELGIMDINNIAFKIEIQSRCIQRQIEPRIHGWIIIGNSNMSSRLGKDHWATMIMSNRAIPRWHKIEKEAF